MSRSAAVVAIVCLAVVAMSTMRVPTAKAWQTTVRTSAQAKRISHTRPRALHPRRHLARQSLQRIVPLLRRVGAHPERSRRVPTAPQAPAPAATVTKPAVATTILPNDPGWAQQWGLRQVEAPAAWALMTGASRQVVVAVVDSGVDPTQPDLQGALVPGADFADSSGSTVDQYGHGTMVAGVIAARGDNGQGVAGVCWTCLIMPIKVLDANGSGTATSIAEGIRWAADHGANVINMSIVLSGPDADVASAIAYAHDKGVIVIAAAGNSGNGDATYPAAYPFVVSVAATDDSDQLYPWSTRGAWVTVAAPGCTLTTALGGSFVTFCGTSAAAPLVAGLAALGYEAGAPSEAELEAALERTAKPLPGAVGSGRVDALQLVSQFGL